MLVCFTFFLWFSASACLVVYCSGVSGYRRCIIVTIKCALETHPNVPLHSCFSPFFISHLHHLFHLLFIFIWRAFFVRKIKWANTCTEPHCNHNLQTLQMCDKRQTIEQHADNVWAMTSITMAVPNRMAMARSACSIDNIKNIDDKRMNERKWI